MCFKSTHKISKKLPIRSLVIVTLELEGTTRDLTKVNKGLLIQPHNFFDCGEIKNILFRISFRKNSYSKPLPEVKNQSCSILNEKTSNLTAWSFAESVNRCFTLVVLGIYLSINKITHVQPSSSFRFLQ